MKIILLLIFLILALFTYYYLQVNNIITAPALPSEISKILGSVFMNICSTSGNYNK